MHFLWIEHNSILVGYLHEVMQMGIMFCLSATMYGDVISNSDTSGALFEELVYLLLEDVLWADQTKGKTQEAVPPKGAVEGSEETSFFIKNYWLVSMMCIELGEIMQICKLVCNIFYSRHLVVIMADCSVAVTQI